MVKEIKSLEGLRDLQEANNNTRKVVETIQTSHNKGTTWKIDNNRAECQIDLTKNPWDGSTLLNDNLLSLNLWAAALNRTICSMIQL